VELIHGNPDKKKREQVVVESKSHFTMDVGRGSHINEKEVGINACQ